MPNSLLTIIILEEIRVLLEMFERRLLELFEPPPNNSTELT